MRNALHEQLLKAGLIDEQRLKDAEREKRREQRQPARKVVAERKPRATDAQQAKKAARDRALNAAREEQAARKALEAELAELVARGRQSKNDGEHAYNFVDGAKVRRLYVTDATREALGDGRFGIVKVRGRYEVVAAEVAAKVAARAPDRLVVLNGGESKQDEGDHPVPDDLMW